MRAYDIATIPNKGRDESGKNIQAFINLVKETSDPDIRGLVTIMTDMIKDHWLYGRLYEGRNVGAQELYADSELLVARLLLDKSSSGNPSHVYVKGQLTNLAWDKGSHVDSVTDWLNAQREYVRDGLEYLIRLKPE